MNKKIYIIIILAIIVTTLSQTVSFISGEHQFYQSVQDKCIKCHGDIKSQLSVSTNHSSSPCNYCHVKSATNHTNIEPACQDCHNTTLKLNNSLEAHTEFSSMESKGCIACHTTYNALVNYSRAEYIDYTITNKYGNWVISNITTIGTMNLSYNAQRIGGDHDIQNVSCKDCHEDIFEAVSLGGHAVVLAKNSTNITNGTQVPYHNNSNTTLEAWCRTCHNRNDANFSTQQHSVRKTTCEECHQAHNLTPHPGNFFANINTVPHLYRSLVCISCHSIGWPAPGGAIHFKVHQEPYYDITYEIIDPLLITNSTPAGDPTTTVGTAQTFSITLNRPAEIYWYNNGSEIFRALSAISSSYISSSSAIGVYNITAVADDGSSAVSRTWNWTVTNQTGNGTGGGGGGIPIGSVITGGATGPSGSNNISGHVFDNNVLVLPGVLVQSGSYQNTTNISGYYSMTGLPNGTYTFSYSKAGFNTNYSVFTLNGASVENVNVIVYDTTPPASVSNINMTTGNFYINNSWANPADSDFNHTWFRYSNGTTLQSLNKSINYLNLTWSPHYTQNISAQTVDNYNNINQTRIWFNTTIPDNPPVQAPIGNQTVYEGQLLTFIVHATDADNDTITYGTNATKGTLNTTTGNFSWVPNYGDSGFYLWSFNSSDGYGGIANENVAVTVINVPLTITNSSPVSDPTTIVGSSQTFSITLNRTANIIWYNNGSEAFRALNVTSATYINSTAGIGTYNITAFANDSYDSALRTWNWTVIPNINGTNVSGDGDGGGGSGGSNNSVSGYVFDNFGLSLGGVLVQNGSYQNTTDASGYYSIANLSNGTYNFSYSKAGFSTAYFKFTLNGAVIMNANRTLYDIMPATSVSNPSMTTGNFYVNNTWVNPIDVDFNYTWFRYSNDTTLQNISKPVNYLNLTWSPHYTQNISAQTVDTSGNVNQTKVWFNTTIPNNAPFQYAIGNKIVNENENLQFNVTATDADNDTITYGTNATKGNFNTTTGNFSWTPSYGDAGIYTWYFNSSDGYGGVATENVTITVNNVPLSITSFSPLSDPATELGTMQNFSIALNRTANVTWYMNGTLVQTNTSIISANYSNSTAGIGKWNVTAAASDSYDLAMKSWNWTIIPQSTYNASGYVLDNYGSGLNGVLVQNGSKQNTTASSGNYLITGLVNGTYNFSYSKAGFNTGYLIVTINGADNTTANKTIYDTTPPASVSSPNIITGNFYINNTWINPGDADFNYTWFRYSNGTNIQNVSKPTNYLNIIWSPHYTQNISAQTVDNYSNVNQTMVWFNATIPNNLPVQATIGNKTVYEGQWLNFTVNATDADNDTITYGSNATKGILNTATGNYSWLTNYGDAGFYYWNFNSSDSYGGIANENVAVTVINVPLSITSFSPLSDPVTELGTMQNFNVALNRTANVTWYINGILVQTNTSVISANYSNSTAGIGKWNVTASATDNIDTTAKTWNWTIIPQSTYKVSGYVFDNYGSGLNGVLVQNGSKQNTTMSSGNYLITGLVNGTYNFSYSKAGFNTGYLEVTINGADNTSANKTLYDTTPPASVSNPATVTGNFYVNNTWTNPVDADYNYTWFRYSNGTTITNVSKPTDYLNLTWSPHYTQNISAQTVDNYSNVNQTMVWFNATIPNNAPVQALIGNKTVYEGQLLNFTINATDADNDTITYGTNATKGTLNTTTGNYSWLTNYGDAGFYFWNFNSSDGYGGIANENVAVTVINVPLSITSSSPVSDPTTINGTTQTFGITLNRTANVIWYINNSVVQSNLSVVSANYTNSTAGIGAHNVTAIANDSYDSALRTWNWTVTPQPTYNVSGYVFDNYGSGLGGVLVQNNSKQNTTIASGYYLITGLLNGTYNFSYSKADFNTGYLEVTINGMDNTSMNKTIYDTTPPASVSNISMATGNFYINNSWINPADADFNYTWFRYSNGTTIQNVSKPTNYLNLTWPPHYTQNISAQTVDNYSNVNQTMIWFNATIPNNAPVQAPIGNKTVSEGQWLNFTVNATDLDNDTITYGTNVTKGTFNTTTGNFSWLTTYADAGVYTWYFNSSDGYGGVARETIIVTVNNVPLSVTSSSPASDPITTAGTAQTFGVVLNRTANVTWYMNGSIVQSNLSVTSANYANSTAGIGTYNVTAIASDSYDSALRTWNWSVIAQPTYNVSGYVFDNYGSGLGGVLVTNGSYLNTTLASGYYLITGLFNGTYNFSYSKAGFNTGYLIVTINGADNTTANKTIYDTTPPASVSNPSTTTDNFYINNTWVNPADVDFNYTWFRYSNGTNIQNVSKPTNYLNLTWSPHYTQNISSQTVDNYGNINQTMIWFNTTIPDNSPVQASIGNKTVNEGQWLNFTVHATDLDNDTMTYGTNATRGTLNTTTGNYSWLTNYGDAGVYIWYFNSSDGYGGVASETITVIVNSIPLSITNSSPASDPITTVGTAQTFSISLNRTANVTWYVNGSVIQANSSIVSANYTNSTAGVGTYNVTAAATDGYYSASKQWNWTVNPQPVYAPGITSWSNNKTNNNSLTLTVNTSEPVNFNATANQTITTWNWYQDGVNQNNNYNNFTTSWNTSGTKTIQVNATNNNGTSNTITWTITVQLAQPVTYSPPSPTNITSTTGNFWVNTTWQPGAGNATDSYNVSVNGIWANGTTNTYVNSSLSAHAWQNITVYAYNASGTGSLSASPATKNTQIPDNPPVQSPIGNKTVYEGQWLNFTVHATDADNDTITYGTNATKGSFNAITGNFSWLTTYSDAGTYIWYFNSSDGYGGVASETITVTVNNVPLSVTSFSPPSDPTTTQGTAQTFNVTLNRTANVTWYMNGSIMQTDSSAASASYTNSTTGTGIWNVTAIATDGIDTASKQWNWTVSPQPIYAPSITSWSNNKTNNNSLALTINTSEAVNFNATANQTITVWNWYKDGVNQNNNYDNLTTSWSTSGTKSIQVNATNSNGTSNTITWTVTVQTVAYIPPPPANINSTTGNFWVNTTWQPGAGNVTNSYNISVNGAWTNGTTSTYANSTLSAHAWQNVTVYAFNASATGSLSVSPATKNTQIPNNPPVQSPIGNKMVNEGQWLNFTVSATDLDNDTITYGTNAAKGSFNVTTGNFSWLTTYSDAGTYIWYFNSSDGYGGVASETITVTVNNIPLSITSFAPSSDPITTQGTAQTFNITMNRTANVTWYMNGTQVQTNTDTTSASYTNSTAGTGTWNVTASAMDGIDAASRAWNWTVNAQPPTAYIPPNPTSLQNATGNFWVNNTWQTGSGNTTDSYNVSVNGTWHNSTTSTYYNNSVGPHGWSNITVWAYNSSGTGSLSSGSVSQNTQVPNNPSIQSPVGNKTVNEGQLLTFTVSATDLDNDTITYGTNATKGTLNTTTGQFSWTPGYGDAGVYVWYFNSSDGYGGVASETITVTVNNVPLSVTNSSPATDPTTTVGTSQAFAISLNRTANVTWYMNGTQVQTNTSTTSANYTNSTVGTGIWNVTASATDGYDIVSKQWNWTVNPQPVYAPSITSWSNSKTNNNSLTLAVNTSETVNFNATVNQTIITWNWYQDGINQNNNYNNLTTSWNTAGTKTIQVNATNSNGTSNTIIWTVTVLAQPVAYIPPSPANITSITGNFWVNTTWQPGAGNTTDSYNVSVNGVWTSGTTSTSVNSSLSAHAWQNVTVYAYNASGSGSLSASPATKNTQIPNNPPVQASIGNKAVTAGNLLTFTVSATDADNDTITYSTNATKGTLNATTGVYSWQTTSNDTGTYIWYFNSSDGYGGVASETINVTVISQPVYNVSGYVFDNYGSGLVGVLVQNGSYQSNTSASGYYLITGLLNGTYNLSYSKAGFNTDYLSIMINGTDIVNANKTIYDATPPASVSNITATSASLYINWTWIDPIDSDFNHVMVYIDGTFMRNITKGVQFYNASYFMPNSTHTISTRTVDIYDNVNTTWVNNTASTPPDYAYVSSLQNDTGTVSDFINALNASDGGASATFTEALMGGTYQLNITTNTTDIPDAGIHTLQLMYNVSGDNFTLQIWNGSAWNNRTTLNDTTLSYRNITLQPEELIPQGIFSGYAGSVNNYYVLVRYLDLDASTSAQGRLYLDYQRIHSE